MEWKRMFLKAAGFGAGFAILLILIGGGLLWYSNRPKPPKAWDAHAIVAEYDYVTTQGDANNIAVYYTLQNNTDFDYEIPSADQIQLAAKLGRENSLSIEKSGGDALAGDFPVFVPAHGRTRFGLHLRYPYGEKYDSAASEDERYDFGTKLAKYMTTELTNLDGFVVLDQTRRYKIELPSGWKARSNEPLKAKVEVHK
jgi:hypothetical protein